MGHICKSLSKRIARRTRKYTGAAYNGVRGQRGPTAQTAPHRRRQNPPQYLGGRVDLLDPIRVARLRLLLCAPAIAEDERSDEPEEADRAAEQNDGVTLHVCADRPHERCGDTRRKTRGEKKRAVSTGRRGDFAVSTAARWRRVRCVPGTPKTMLLLRRVVARRGPQVCPSLLICPCVTDTFPLPTDAPARRTACSLTGERRQYRRRRRRL